MSIIADKVTWKQIQDEYERKCEELRQTHKEEYEAFEHIRAQKREPFCVASIVRNWKQKKSQNL